MFELLGTVLTGGATGIIGTILGKGIAIFEGYQKEKATHAEHLRTMEMHRLQHELKSQELESERLIVQEQAASDLRRASYVHDSSAGNSDTWVVNILRLVRPFITLLLIILVAILYFSNATEINRIEIVHSLIYMASSATLWWFGDRTLRNNK